MHRDDQEASPPGTSLKSRIYIGTILVCAAITVFLVGYLSSGLLRSPRNSRDKQVSKVPAQTTSGDLTNLPPEVINALTGGSGSYSQPEYPSEPEAEEIRITLGSRSSHSNTFHSHSSHSSSPPAVATVAPSRTTAIMPAVSTTPVTPRSSAPLVKELPSLTDKDEFTLHTWPELRSQDVTFTLDTSAAAAPKGTAFVLQEMEAEERTWQVLLKTLPKSATPTNAADAAPEATTAVAPEHETKPQPLGMFRMVGGELRYQWLSSAPVAAQIANCVPTVRWGTQRQKLILRRPQQTRDVEISMSKPAPFLPASIDAVPKLDCLEFQLDKLEGFDEMSMNPHTGVAKIGSRLRVRPSHSKLDVEFDISLLVRNDDLVIQPKPVFLLSENNRQEFSTEKLESAIKINIARIQKDMGRLAYANKRVREIPGQIQQVNEADAQLANKMAALAILGREQKSSTGTIKSLNASIPRSQELVKELDLYLKFAQSLDGKVKLKGRLFAVAESAEILLWIAE